MACRRWSRSPWAACRASMRRASARARNWALFCSRALVDSSAKTPAASSRASSCVAWRSAAVARSWSSRPRRRTSSASADDEAAACCEWSVDRRLDRRLEDTTSTTAPPTATPATIPTTNPMITRADSRCSWCPSGPARWVTGATRRAYRWGVTADGYGGHTGWGPPAVGEGGEDLPRRGEAVASETMHEATGADATGADATGARAAGSRAAVEPDDRRAPGRLRENPRRVGVPGGPLAPFPATSSSRTSAWPVCRAPSTTGRSSCRSRAGCSSRSRGPDTRSSSPPWPGRCDPPTTGSSPTTATVPSSSPWG